MNPSSPPALIKVQGLSRRYGDQLVVKNVDFSLQRGEVLGFLGPNGAGKSTTMQMLCGVLAPSAGEILIDGIDLLEQPRKARQRIGYLPENPPLYRDLTVDEYLHYCARLHGLKKPAVKPAIEQARSRCGLDTVGPRLIGNLSKGYQQRVGIAQAILHDPALVVLDEPTVGLDPIQIREIRELIRSLGESHGVILSTHILPEVQSVCDRVQIIRNGELIYQTPIEELDRRSGASLLRLELRQPPSLEVLRQLPGVRDAVALPRPGHFELHLEDCGEATDERIEQLAAEILQAGWGLRALCPGSSSLEDLFIELATADEATLTSGEAA